MAAADTTTIRVPTETRDQLNALALRRGEPAGEVVAKLVRAADEETLLAEVAAGFEKLPGDPEALAAYRAETESSIVGGAVSLATRSIIAGETEKLPDLAEFTLSPYLGPSARPSWPRGCTPLSCCTWRAA